MTDFQIFVAVGLTIFGALGLIYLACLPPPKRDPEEENESESERRYREMSQ